MKKIRFGIVGCGNVAKIHAQAIRHMDSAILSAACSRTASCLDDFCSVNECAGFSNLDKFLKDADVDVVNVCTPSGAHVEPASKAAEAGKHVVVEKPIEVTLEKADKIIHCCREKGVLLGVIFQSRFFKASRLLKQAIDQNLFGKLTLGSAYVRWFRPQSYYDNGKWRGTWVLDGGGALMNQSIHAIDLLQWLMGDVQSVQAFTTTLTHTNIEVEDTGTAVLKFRNGALGVIEGSTSAFPGYAKRIEISGERGTVILTEDRITEWSFAEPTALDKEAKRLTEGESKGGATDPMAIAYAGHKAQLEDFVAAVRENGRPLVDGIEGRKSLEIVLAIYRASEAGRRVDLPLQ